MTMFLSELKVGTFHLFRYTNQGAHACPGHVRAMTRMYCYHCNVPGECAHLYSEKCDCYDRIACADCLFVAEGGML